MPRLCGYVRKWDADKTGTGVVKTGLSVQMHDWLRHAFSPCCVRHSLCSAVERYVFSTKLFAFWQCGWFGLRDCFQGSVDESGGQRRHIDHIADCRLIAI